MNSPDKNTGVGSFSFLQGIFLTQGSNPGLPHCMWIPYQLSHKGSPWYIYAFVYMRICVCVYLYITAQLVKNLPAMQETLVLFLGGEDPLEKG